MWINNFNNTKAVITKNEIKKELKNSIIKSK